MVSLYEDTRKIGNNTINSGLRLVDRHGDKLNTYIAVLTGGQGTKVPFIVKWILMI